MHSTDVWTRRLALAALLTALGGAAVAAEPEPSEPLAESSEETSEDGLTSAERLERAIRVVQQRPILRDLRLELIFTGGVAAADTMYRHGVATGTMRFHVSEWVSIGATYAHYFSEESELFRRVTEDFELFPERSEIRWYAGADVSVVPIDGKFILFGELIVYWDIYASIGGGVTTTSRSSSPKPTGMIGVGLRMFLAKWLTLTFELRNHIFVEDFNAGSEIVNNVVGQGGISIFIPFGFDYTYPR